MVNWTVEYIHVDKPTPTPISLVMRCNQLHLKLPVPVQKTRGGKLESGGGWWRGVSSRTLSDILEKR
jgi:hypothetical protein